jgi:hypothetical protein
MEYEMTGKALLRVRKELRKARDIGFKLVSKSKNAQLRQMFEHIDRAELLLDDVNAALEADLIKG